MAALVSINTTQFGSVSVGDPRIAARATAAAAFGVDGVANATARATHKPVAVARNSRVVKYMLTVLRSLPYLVGALRLASLEGRDSLC